MSLLEVLLVVLVAVVLVFAEPAWHYVRWVWKWF
jgi:hypothetical protein